MNRKYPLCLILIATLFFSTSQFNYAGQKEKSLSSDEIETFANRVAYFLNMFGVQCAEHIFTDTKFIKSDLKGVELWLVDWGDADQGQPERVWRWTDISNVNNRALVTREDLAGELRGSKTERADLMKKIFTDDHAIFEIGDGPEEKTVFALGLRWHMEGLNEDDAAVWGDRDDYYAASAAKWLVYRYAQERVDSQELGLPVFPQVGAFRGDIYPLEEVPLGYLLATRDALHGANLAASEGDEENLERLLKNAKYWHEEFKKYGDGELDRGFRQFAITQGIAEAYGTTAFDIAKIGGCSDLDDRGLLELRSKEMKGHFVAHQFGFLGIWNDLGSAVDPLARLRIGKHWIAQVFTRPAQTLLDFLMSTIEIAKSYRPVGETGTGERLPDQLIEFNKMISKKYSHVDPRLELLSDTDKSREYVRLSIAKKFVFENAWDYIIDIVGLKKPERFPNLTFWRPAKSYKYEVVDSGGDVLSEIKLKKEALALRDAEGVLPQEVRDAMSLFMTQNDACKTEEVKDENEANFILLVHRDYIDWNPNEGRVTINPLHPYLEGSAAGSVTEFLEDGSPSWLCLDLR